jgi:hypothetical protein
VSLYLASRLPNSIENYRPIFFTSRFNFDAYLVSLAQNAGVTLFEQSIVSGISQNPSIIRIRRDRTLAADFIVGADGVNSQVAKSLMKPDLTNLIREPQRPRPRGLPARRPGPDRRASDQRPAALGLGHLAWHCRGCLIRPITVKPIPPRQSPDAYAPLAKVPHHPIEFEKSRIVTSST